MATLESVLSVGDLTGIINNALTGFTYAFVGSSAEVVVTCRLCQKRVTYYEIGCSGGGNLEWVAALYYDAARHVCSDPDED